MSPIAAGVVHMELNRGRYRRHIPRSALWAGHAVDRDAWVRDRYAALLSAAGPTYEGTAEIQTLIVGRDITGATGFA